MHGRAGERLPEILHSHHSVGQTVRYTRVACKAMRAGKGKNGWELKSPQLWHKVCNSNIPAFREPDVVVGAYNPSVREAEAG